MAKIKLGIVVRDKLTGIIGVTDNVASYLYGCDRYCVQPFPKEGEVEKPKSIMVDEPQLEVVADREPLMEAPPAPGQIVKLGQVVFDPIKNMKGVCTGRAVYLNGCSRILVELDMKNSKDLDFDSYWIDELRVQPSVNVVGGKPIMGHEPRDYPASSAPAASRGGPAVNSERA